MRPALRERRHRGVGVSVGRVDIAFRMRFAALQRPVPRPATARRLSPVGASRWRATGPAQRELNARRTVRRAAAASAASQRRSTSSSARAAPTRRRYPASAPGITRADSTPATSDLGQRGDTRRPSLAPATNLSLLAGAQLEVGQRDGEFGMGQASSARSAAFDGVRRLDLTQQASVMTIGASSVPIVCSSARRQARQPKAASRAASSHMRSITPTLPRAATPRAAGRLQPRQRSRPARLPRAHLAARRVRTQADSAATEINSAAATGRPSISA